jgi:hypothetical protein
VDPDVFITIAFCVYAFLVCLGIGVAVRGPSAKHDRDRRIGARRAVLKPEQGRDGTSLGASEPQT